MALVYTEEQVMLKDSARSFLAERAPISHLRALRDDQNRDGFSRDLWAEMAEMGWAAILVPESHGGLEYGYTGLGILLEETGRTLTPSPLLSTALTAVSALIKAGSEQQQSEILPGIAAGERILALACEDQSTETTVSSNEAGGYELNGTKTAVHDGHVADTFIVSADLDGQTALFLVPSNAAGVIVEPYAVLDTHYAAQVQFDQVTLPADSRMPASEDAGAVLEQVLDAARIGTSAEMLGNAQEAFERTLQYLKERKQFGVLIGSFQALQHRAAFLFGEIENCKSLVIKALQMLDQEQSEPGAMAEMASLVKAKLSETAHLAAAEAVQMHGGIGMTDEFDIGFFLKRVRILETLYGDRYEHLDRFALLRGY